MIIDSPGSHSESQESLKVKEGGGRRGSEGNVKNSQRDAVLLVLKMEEEGHKARMWAASSSWERQWILP